MHAQDRIGRRPVIIGGSFGAGVFVALFGFSRSLFGLIVCRGMAGAVRQSHRVCSTQTLNFIKLTGNVTAIKATLSELTDETNKARAYSLLPLSWLIGSVIGACSI